METRPITLLQL